MRIGKTVYRAGKRGLSLNKEKLWKLFTSTLMISAFTFGGGYVIVPLMKKKFVDELKWLEEEETIDFIAIAQSSPGAIAVNASILLGYRIAGFVGAVITILGTILPPMLIITVVSVFYEQFKSSTGISAVLDMMRAGVSALIISVVADMGMAIVKKKDIISIIIMVAVFVAVYFLKLNIIFIIIACGVIGVVKTYVLIKRGRA